VLEGIQERGKKKKPMSARKTNVLAAESDPQVLRLITTCLGSEGYEVNPVEDEPHLFKALEATEPDLVLLGTFLFESHDFELCRQVRSMSLVPIIVISAQKQVYDKVRALDAGADDYLTKPLSIIELLAQVRASLRRIQWNINASLPNLRPTLTCGNLVVDLLRHRVTIDERPVALTPIEYHLLSYLAQNAGRIVTHNLLLEKVWGREYSGENNLLKVYINRLRHKIEPDLARPRYILTRTGLGYFLATEPAQYLSGACKSSQRGT
jgi:DNA-binding response OmpR family regulator